MKVKIFSARLSGEDRDASEVNRQEQISKLETEVNNYLKDLPNAAVATVEWRQSSAAASGYGIFTQLTAIVTVS